MRDIGQSDRQIQWILEDISGIVVVDEIEEDRAPEDYQDDQSDQQQDPPAQRRADGIGLTLLAARRIDDINHRSIISGSSAYLKDPQKDWPRET